MSDKMSELQKEQAVTNEQIRSAINLLSEKMENIEDQLKGYILSSKELMNRNSDRIETLKIEVALHKKDIEDLKKRLSFQEKNNLELMLIKRDVEDSKEDAEKLSKKIDDFIDEFRRNQLEEKEDANKLIMNIMWKVIGGTIAGMTVAGSILIAAYNMIVK